MTILAHLGFQDAPESLQDASKARSRASKTPQEPPRCLQDTPREAKKLYFSLCFQSFRFPGPAWSYPGLNLPPRRLQEPPDSFQGPPRRFQEPPLRLHQPPRRPPRASEIRPRPSLKPFQIVLFTMFFNMFAFLGLLGAIFAQHGRQTPSIAPKNAFEISLRPSKIPPNSSKDCLRASRPLPRTAPNCLQLRAWPCTKGGLAVVRPRRASSIYKYLTSKAYK